MIDLNALDLRSLYKALTADGSVKRLVEAALHEDARSPGDITSQAIIAAEAQAKGMVVPRREGVVAGLAAIPDIIGVRSLSVTCFVLDGGRCKPAQALAELSGLLRDMLLLERVVLNLIGRMCGVATLTRAYVDAVAGTRALICDTRKTTPGLRALEKYAVRCGGGTLHRLGLFDAGLFKDNHLAGIPLDALAATVAQAAASVRSKHDARFVEVEVDTLNQLRELIRIDAGLIDIVLLDNMSVAELGEAVALRDRHAPHLLLEASGGVTLETVRSIAEAGVDRISVGAITHSAPPLDVGLDVRP